jgi:tetratricopeptide (TPR) repeat protein
MMRRRVAIGVVLVTALAGAAISLAQQKPIATPSSAPLDLTAAYDKGTALAASGKLQDARAVFEAAARQDPGDGTIASGLALLRDVEAGRASLDVVQRIFGAMDHATAGRWPDAHRELDEALRLAPKYARAHGTKAQLYVHQGQYPAAVTALDTALLLDPSSAEAFYNRGAVRAELKQFDAAIADYTRALALQPTYWYAYRNRGSAYTHKRDPKAALADYGKALELRPQDVDTRLLRAVVNAATGQWDAALPDLSKVIELDPSLATAWYHRGLAHQQKGDVERARADFMAAIKSDTSGEVAAASRQQLAKLGAPR